MHSFICFMIVSWDASLASVILIYFKQAVNCAVERSRGYSLRTSLFAGKSFKTSASGGAYRIGRSGSPRISRLNRLQRHQRRRQSGAFGGTYRTLQRHFSCMKVLALKTVGRLKVERFNRRQWHRDKRTPSSPSYKY